MTVAGASFYPWRGESVSVTAVKRMNSDDNRQGANDDSGLRTRSNRVERDNMAKQIGGTSKRMADSLCSARWWRLAQRYLAAGALANARFPPPC